MDLDEASAAFVLGGLASELLPDIATAALMAGTDSPSMFRLAGEPAHQVPADLRELFQKAISELGRTLPSRLQAARLLKYRIAHQVSAGLLAPREGAARIVSLLRDIEPELPNGQFVGSSWDVAELVGHYYAYDDVDPADAESIAQIGDSLLTECRRIAAGARHNQPMQRPGDETARH